MERKLAQKLRLKRLYKKSNIKGLARGSYIKDKVKITIQTTDTPPSGQADSGQSPDQSSAKDPPQMVFDDSFILEEVLAIMEEEKERSKIRMGSITDCGRWSIEDFRTKGSALAKVPICDPTPKAQSASTSKSPSGKISPKKSANATTEGSANATTKTPVSWRMESDEEDDMDTFFAVFKERTPETK